MYTSTRYLFYAKSHRTMVSCPAVIRHKRWRRIHSFNQERFVAIVNSSNTQSFLVKLSSETGKLYNTSLRLLGVLAQARVIPHNQPDGKSEELAQFVTGAGLHKATNSTLHGKTPWYHGPQSQRWIFLSPLPAAVVVVATAAISLALIAITLLRLPLRV